MFLIVVCGFYVFEFLLFDLVFVSGGEEGYYCVLVKVIVVEIECNVIVICDDW